MLNAVKGGSYFPDGNGQNKSTVLKEQINQQRQSVQKFFHMGKIMLWIVISALRFLNHLSSHVSRDWKHGLFYKCDNVRFPWDSWFIYEVMEHCIRPSRCLSCCHDYYLVCCNRCGDGQLVENLFTVWPTYSLCIMAYHISCYTTTRVCTCQVWFSKKVLFLVIVCEALGTRICCALHCNHKVHSACNDLTNSSFCFVWSFHLLLA